MSIKVQDTNTNQQHTINVDSANRMLFDGQVVATASGAGLPLGSVVGIPRGHDIPDDYLVCDGSTFNISVYPGLQAYLNSNRVPDYTKAGPVNFAGNKSLALRDDIVWCIKATTGITTNQATDILNAMISLNINVKADSTTVTGPNLVDGCSIKVMFTQDIFGTDDTTDLEVEYNGDTLPIKISVGGVLQGIKAHEISSGTYKYLQAYTTLEMIYDDTGSQFILVGNPLLLSGTGYTIYADGYNYVEYTRNQIELEPTPSIRLVGFSISTPGWTYTDLTQNYTLLYDGIVNIHYPMNGVYVIITDLSGTETTLYAPTIHSSETTTVLELRKGYKIRFSSSNENWLEIQYYKLRDYTGR